MSAAPQPEESEQRAASGWLLAVVAGVVVGLGAYWAMLTPEETAAPAPVVQHPAPPVQQVEPTPAPIPEAARQIHATEEVTQELVLQLRALSDHYAGAEGGALPNAPSAVFTATATARALNAPGGLGASLAPGAVRVLDWGSSEAASTPHEVLRALLVGLTRMEHVHFEIEYGRPVAGEPGQAESLFHFELVGRSTGGLLRSAGGSVEARWTRAGDTQEGPWQIASFAPKHLQTVEVRDWLFRDALGAIVTPETRQALEHSVHADKLRAVLEHGAERQPRHPFEFASLDRHPGLAVVDIDGDGWDDIYLMPRWGKNQLLLNQRGKRFVEDAARWGLDLEHTSSSAIFADYDNDGDQDVIIGRTLSESLYLVQEGGRFRRAGDDATGGPLPRLVSSVSVVDYDQDGLLDVYFSTYAATMAHEARGWMQREKQLGAPALSGFVSPEAAVRLGKSLGSETYSAYLDRPGPPNILYRNVGGGRFEEVDSALAVDRNTFQATWSDYDGDGDQDVYVSNDYAPNHLFRNEGGTFVDVTEATGTADIGFGMGASWADYDGDGRFDLYTSNMYSRAGRRITGAIEALDPRLKRAARGNTLFKNQGDTFERTSSLGPDGLQVERAGWSWGGQFGDLNNDGLVDLHVLNGHYSAPEEVAIDRDT